MATSQQKTGSWAPQCVKSDAADDWVARLKRATTSQKCLMGYFSANALFAGHDRLRGGTL